VEELRMATTDSLASIFFSTLIRDEKNAFAILSSLASPTSPYRESEWIEYKSGFYQNPTDIPSEWSTQLSGFANSGDGIVIWGIKTKPFNKYDVPDKVVLVPDADKLAGELETLKTYAVEPPVHGVVVRAYTNGSANGFVVAFIPESKRKPHQVRLNDSKVQDRYYIRNGHQTEPIRQSLLRLLFYPQLFPQLELTLKLNNLRSNTPSATLTLKNIGTVSVSELYVVVTDKDRKILFEQDTINFVKVTEIHDEIGIKANNAFHPEMSIAIGALVVSDRSLLTVSAYAKDMKPFRWTIKEEASGNGWFKPYLDE
jgi:hypothetical protein